MSAETTLTFAELALAPAVLQAVDEVGYESPSPIQAQTIPPLLEGRDLLGQAQTGTGKTAAFALPMLSRINPKQLKPQGLVLAPTRELAIQVAEAMQTYARHIPGFHILPIYGGQSYGTQLRQLQRGAQVIVGTPGRILDHLHRGTLKLDTLSTLVLDEADEMLRMGFIDDVEEIIRSSPEQKQIVLFSATMPEAIGKIARRYLREPVEIRIKAKTATVESVSQYYWQVSGTHKLDALTRILECEDFDAMIIFVRTKTGTVELSEKLEARGYACAALNGDINQAMREATVDRLRRGGLDIIVATDVAARGLDVERVSHVLNYDIPYDTEAYIHRIGRTGRAGRSGKAILFVSPRETRLLRAIEKVTRQTITHLQLPTREDVSDRRISQFKQKITETLDAQDLAFYEEVIASYQRESDVGLSEIAAALALLLQKDRPLTPEKAPKSEKPARAEKPARPEKMAKAERQDQPEKKAKAERPDRPEKHRKVEHDEESEAKPAREPRPRRDEDEGEEDIDWIGYRIEVGATHGVKPANIVGAIANEADIESRYIRKIEIHDDYSTLLLPDGMPKQLFRHLQKVWVCGRQLQISPKSDRTRKPVLSINKPPRASKESDAPEPRGKSGPKRSPAVKGKPVRSSRGRDEDKGKPRSPRPGAARGKPAAKGKPQGKGAPRAGARKPRQTD